MSKRPVVLASTGDHHVCSTLGLCPNEGVRLDEGGRYEPNKAQLWLWDGWNDYWSQVDATVRDHKADLAVLLNGDARDTVGTGHHGTPQIISANQEVQDYVTERVFGAVRQRKPKWIWVNRGTEVHVGPSGSSEESLARWLHAEKDPTTEAWSSWHWRLQIHGCLIDATHHTNMGGLPWTEPSAALKLAAVTMMEYTRRGEEPPDLVFRSHVHRHADSHDAYPTRAVILPAWQLMTGYAHRVSPIRLPDIGGGITVILPDGSYDHRTVLYRPDPPVIWRAA